MHATNSKTNRSEKLTNVFSVTFAGNYSVKEQKTEGSRGPIYTR